MPKSAVFVRMDDKVKKKMEKAARDERRSLANMVQVACEQWLAKRTAS
jgi:predicted transcriptional regulator